MDAGELKEQDEFGQEMADTARVWRVYVKESSKHDDYIVNEWNRTADIILLFAALFSAVVTAFTIESYKMLSPNPQDVTNMLLFDISQSLRSTQAGSGLANATAISGTDFQTSSSAIWINALWFTALSCSLGVGSVAMLVKQWLSAYLVGLPAAPGRLRAQVRQYRYDSLCAWRTQTIINTLPFGLSICLVLFLAGLSILLFGLNQHIAILSLIILAITVTFHMASIILPAVCNCPWKTAISPVIYRPLFPLRGFLRLLTYLPGYVLTAISTVMSFLQYVAKRFRLDILFFFILGLIMLPFLFLVFVFKLLMRIVKWIVARSILHRYRFVWPSYMKHIAVLVAKLPSKVVSLVKGLPAVTSEAQDELDSVNRTADFLEARAILWLTHASGEITAGDYALQAIAGLPSRVVSVVALQQGGAMDLIRDRLRSCIRNHTSQAFIATELYMRGLLRMRLLLRSSLDERIAAVQSDFSTIFKDIGVSSDHPAFYTALCAKGQLAEIIDVMEQHSTGSINISPFHLCLMADTLGQEIACKKGPKDDHWVSSQTGGWSQLCARAIPTLVKLLDVESCSWPNVAEPQALDAALAFAIAMFTQGRSLVDIDVYLEDQNRRRDFHYLVLTGLSPILHFPASYGCRASKLLALVRHKFITATRSYARKRGLPQLQDQSGMIMIIRSSLSPAADHDKDLNPEDLLYTLSHLDEATFISIDCSPLVKTIGSPNLSLMTCFHTLACLEKVAAVPSRAAELVRTEVIQRISRLIKEHGWSPLRSQAFRVLGRIARRASESRRGLHEKMIEQGLLEAAEDFFSNPGSITQDDVDIWVSVFEDLCCYHQSVVVKSNALEAMIKWSLNNWKGSELMVCHRDTLDTLARKVGLTTELRPTFDWFRAYEPSRHLVARAD